MKRVQVTKPTMLLGVCKTRGNSFNRPSLVHIYASDITDVEGRYVTRDEVYQYASELNAEMISYTPSLEE
jgi:hypothetical protein